jgi:DNA-binding transcriptional LysR family regulator
VDAGGFTPAAHRLVLSKSIVSRRLARLEDELGVQLLVRTTRGIGLTEAGATFREHAVRVAAEIDAAREAISPEGDVRGRLRIAVPLSFGTTHLAPVLAELARRHPRLQVHAAYSDRFVDLVGEGFDAALRLGYLPDSSLVARRIAPIRGKIVASPAYIDSHGAPRAPEELVHHESLLQRPGDWQFRHGDKVINVRPQGRFVADSGQALVAAALAGLGIAMLPTCVVKSNMYMSHGTINRCPEVRTAECGAQLAGTRDRHDRSGCAAIASVRALATPGVSLPAGSSDDRPSGTRRRAIGPDHAQAAGQHRA